MFKEDENVSVGVEVFLYINNIIYMTEVTLYFLNKDTARWFV